MAKCPDRTWTAGKKVGRDVTFFAKKKYPEPSTQRKFSGGKITLRSFTWNEEQSEGETR